MEVYLPIFSENSEGGDTITLYRKVFSEGLLKALKPLSQEKTGKDLFLTRFSMVQTFQDIQKYLPKYGRNPELKKIYAKTGKHSCHVAMEAEEMTGKAKGSRQETHKQCKRAGEGLALSPKRGNPD